MSGISHSAPMPATQHAVVLLKTWLLGCGGGRVAATVPAGAGVSLLTEGVVADAVADPVGLLERGEEAAERRRAHPRLERRHHDPEPTTTRQPSNPDAVLVDEGTTALRAQPLEEVDRTDEVVGAEASHVIPQHVQLAPGHVAASLIRVSTLAHPRIVGAYCEHALLGKLAPVGDPQGGVDLGGARDVGLAVGRVTGDADLERGRGSGQLRTPAG